MRIVGEGIPLREGHTRVTGAEKYAPDRSLPGALWMKILRSPYAHARIKRIDTAIAEAMPGIRAVLTHKDVPRKEIRCKTFNWKGKILDDRVRFVGDEVAAIAGENGEAAWEALGLVRVEYDKLPAVYAIEEALQPDAPDVSGTGNNRISSPPDPGTFPSLQEWGDIKKGFAEADAIVENVVTTSLIYPTFCPPACIADWSGDKLTLVLSHQCPYDVRAAVSETLDIPENRVRVIAPLVAVAYGLLNSAHRFWYLAALLSRKTGRPVVYKMTSDELGVYKAKEADVIRVRMGGKRDGRVTALEQEHLHDNGGYGWKTTTYEHIHDIFSRASVRSHASGVNTNKLSTGCIRGVGDVPQAIAVNQTLDMLAEKLGLDPLAVWKMNHHKAGDPRHSDSRPGNTLSSEAYDELIDKGAEAIEWRKKWLGWGKPYRVTGAKKRGVGMAVAVHASGIPALPASTTIEINRDGTALVSIGSMEIGTGCKTTFAQVGAEVLGLKIEDVYVVKEVDTETVPYMCMTGASTSLHVGGSAIKVAALDARRQLLELAYAAPWSPESLKREVAGPEDMDIKDSVIYVKANPDISLAVKDIVSPMPAPQVIGRALRHDLPSPGVTAFITLAGFADVEVDTETGMVNVLKLVACQDSGRIINPQVGENQVYGGTLMSYGYALMEEIVLDPVTGRILNPALSDYWMPTSLDTPRMDVIFSANIDPVGPLGAKGMGEAPAICPHAAIASAIYNAAGVRLKQLPITPDKILKALGRIK